MPDGYRAWHTREATPLANGGRVLLLAGRLSLDGPGVRTFFGIGYELGFLEHLLGSLWFETDGESISESLLVEAALHGGFYVLPSLAAGVGVVATQLDPRGADAAIRVRLTAAWPAVGFFTDFDIFPGDGHVSVSLGARVGH